MKTLNHNFIDNYEGTGFESIANTGSGVANKLASLNSTANPYHTDHMLDINSEYTEAEYNPNDNHILMDVRKLSDDGSVEVDKHTSLTSLFYADGVETELDYVSFKFSWDAYDTAQDELGCISLKNNNDYGVTLKLTNHNETSFVFDNQHGTQISQITEPSEIGFYTGNSMDGVFFDVKVEYDHEDSLYYIKARLRKDGVKSIWYSAELGTMELNSFEVFLPAVKSDSIVLKKLTVLDIFVDGFYTDKNYRSEIYDSGVPGTNWEEIIVSGQYGYDKIFEDNNTTSKIVLDVYSFDDRDEQGDATEYLIEPGAKNFEESLELDLDGRYMFYEMTLSTTRHQQNLVDNITFNYEVEDSFEPVDLPSKLSYRDIGPDGGIISLETDYYNCRLYIPEGALEETKKIKIARLSSDNDILQEDMLGFGFGPKDLSFNKPVMLEIDYRGFGFNDYQSEDGLTLSEFKDNVFNELERTVDKNDKKIVTYLEHF